MGIPSASRTCRKETTISSRENLTSRLLCRKTAPDMARLCPGSSSAIFFVQHKLPLQIAAAAAATTETTETTETTTTTTTIESTKIITIFDAFAETVTASCILPPYDLCL